MKVGAPQTMVTLAFAIFIALAVANAATTTAPTSCKPDENGKCASGVCDECCNAFIPDDQCAKCVAEDCPAAAHNCTPDPTTNKCDDPAVCADCCNKYIPEDQCDACVTQSCPNPGPKPDPSNPSWLPDRNWCFASDPQGASKYHNYEPCGKCGLVFNTAAVSKPGAPGAPVFGYGTLNYTGFAWGVHGKPFQCINMKYTYDNKTGLITFPGVNREGTMANQCLAAFVDPPQRCQQGSGPSLSKPDDWNFSIGARTIECIRKNIDNDPTSACGLPILDFSDAFKVCVGIPPSVSLDSQMRFQKKTNGAASMCRAPFEVE